MYRLIDASALDKKLARLMFKYAWQAREERVADYAFCRSVLMAAPTIDPESIRPHGRWVEYDCYKCNSDGEPVIKTATVLVCSVCGREERYREPYCHCGAKMDLEEDDV